MAIRKVIAVSVVFFMIFSMMPTAFSDDVTRIMDQEEYSTENDLYIHGVWIQNFTDTGQGDNIIMKNGVITLMIADDQRSWLYVWDDVDNEMEMVYETNDVSLGILDGTWKTWDEQDWLVSKNITIGGDVNVGWANISWYNNTGPGPGYQMYQNVTMWRGKQFIRQTIGILCNDTAPTQILNQFYYYNRNWLFQTNFTDGETPVDGNDSMPALNLMANNYMVSYPEVENYTGRYPCHWFTLDDRNVGSMVLSDNDWMCRKFWGSPQVNEAHEMTVWHGGFMLDNTDADNNGIPDEIEDANGPVRTRSSEITGLVDDISIIHGSTEELNVSFTDLPWTNWVAGQLTNVTPANYTFWVPDEGVTTNVTQGDLNYKDERAVYSSDPGILVNYTNQTIVHAGDWEFVGVDGWKGQYLGYAFENQYFAIVVRPIGGLEYIKGKSTTGQLVAKAVMNEMEFFKINGSSDRCDQGANYSKVSYEIIRGHIYLTCYEDYDWGRHYQRYNISKGDSTGFAYEIEYASRLDYGTSSIQIQGAGIGVPSREYIDWGWSDVNGTKYVGNGTNDVHNTSFDHDEYMAYGVNNTFVFVNWFDCSTASIAFVDIGAPGGSQNNGMYTHYYNVGKSVGIGEWWNVTARNCFLLGTGEPEDLVDDAIDKMQNDTVYDFAGITDPPEPEVPPTTLDQINALIPIVIAATGLIVVVSVLGNGVIRPMSRIVRRS